MKYNILHLHSDYSNGVTSIDSVTKFDQYIKKAKEEGMTALAFTEHGCAFDWYKKKEYCESNGLKYIHAVEMYITKTLDEKIRDNYHCCLYSANYEGFLELNKLMSKSFNRIDNSYYYNPRITLDDLLNTSDNIIITSACIGGIFGKADTETEQIVLEFMKKNKQRCFLEVQHHLDNKQVELNLKLSKISNETGIQLIVGTDTHALNNRHAKGRAILQKSKSISFDGEDSWDITFKTSKEIYEMLAKQNVLSKEDILKAMNNTIVLSDMVEEFKIDKSYKYPKLYDDGLSVLKQRINEGVKTKEINKLSNYKSEYLPRIMYELDTYIHNGAIDFLLLDEDIKAEMRKLDIYPGYSRGSCSGSLIAYLIGMTDIDSIKHKMNFERFMNKERVSLADVDTDWQPNHREIVKDYIYKKEGLYCADIITFNTVALKGSIRDVCKALYSKEASEELIKKYREEAMHYGKPTDWTSDEVKKYTKSYLEIANYICENVEDNEKKMRKEYPEVFEYVDIINGTIVSIGTHPCGTIVSPIPLDDSMGLCTISTCERPVSMLSMKCVDAQNYTKLDILGLDNMQLINETCKLANIERLTPENVPDDEAVWKSMAENNLLIFQWESDSAGAFLKNLLSDSTLNKIKKVNPDFRYVDLVSMGNGAIRPAGASYRNELSDGKFRDNGHKALNDFLAPTSGFLVYQEQILEFLHDFCGFTMGEADIVRRGFAKKTGTEQFMPRIKSGFIKTMKEKYNVNEDKSEELIVNFIQVIEDASSYLFSLNHSEPYTYIGYVCAYLRYYYPLEFLSVALNINSSNQEKTAKIIDYANSRGITFKACKWGYSKGECFYDKDSSTLYSGVGSLKYLNDAVADGLYFLSKNKKYDNFIDLLIDMQQTSINSRQLEILIKLDFFDVFGKSQKLLSIYNYFQLLYGKKSFKKSTLETKAPELIYIIPKHSTETPATYKNLDSESMLNEIVETIPNKSIPVKELLSFQLEVLGYIDYKNSNLDKKYVLVTEVNTRFSPIISTLSLNSGKAVDCKCTKKLLSEKPIKSGDIIYISKMSKKDKMRKVGEDENGKAKFEKVVGEFWWHIDNYSIIKNLDEVLEG